MKRKRKWRAKLVPSSTDPVVTKLTSGYHEVFSGLGNHNSIKAKRCAPHQRRLHCFWQSNEDYDKALGNLLRRFSECGLTFNPEKCMFRLLQIEFFGFIFSKDGIKVSLTQLRGDDHTLCDLTH